MRVAANRQGSVQAVTPAVPALAILLAGYAAQSATYINHDVAWVLYSSALMLHGAKFGTDIVAANPPLIWWVSMLPNAAAELLSIPAIAAFRLFVLLLIALSLVSCDRLLAVCRASAAARLLFLLTGAYVLTIGVGRDYGQREHLAALLVLPYVLAVAARMDARSLPAAGAFGVGIAAGIGVAFKPHFVLIPLLLEGALVWRRRSPLLLVRPEALGALASVTLYAAAIVLFAGAWLFGTLPEISRVYWAFEEPLSGRLGTIAVQFAPLIVATAIVLRSRPAAPIVTLSLAGAGFFAAALLQAKYYSYHLYPAFALLLLGVAAGIASMPKPRAPVVTGLFAMALAFNLYDSGRNLIDRSGRGAFGESVASTVAVIERETPATGAFLAFSTHPYPGFPDALYAGRRWASASNSCIFLPAVVRLREAGAPQSSALLRFAQAKAHEAALRDISRRPDLVLIDRRGYRHAIGTSRFDFLAFYLEDPRFRRAWAAYVRLPSAPDGFAAYVRRPGNPS
jgi:hypothetical protein